MGLSLLLVLYSAPRDFFPGTPVFPSPQKQAFLNSNSDLYFKKRKRWRHGDFSCPSFAQTLIQNDWWLLRFQMLGPLQEKNDITVQWKCELYSYFLAITMFLVNKESIISKYENKKLLRTPKLLADGKYIRIILGWCVRKMRIPIFLLCTCVHCN